MSDRSTRPRPVPAAIEAHRVVPGPARGTVGRPAGARDAAAPDVSTGGPAGSPRLVSSDVRAPAASRAPALHAPTRRPSAAGVEAARVARTVDALRRLQTTLSAAQATLDGVIRDISRVVDPPAGGRPQGVPGAAAARRRP